MRPGVRSRLVSGRDLRRMEGFRAGAGSLAFAPDGLTIATANGYEPIVRIRDVATGREVFPHSGHAGQVDAVVVSPADGTVFTGSYDGTVRHWDPATGRELGLIGRFHSVYALAVSPEGRTLIVGHDRGDPIVWSVPDLLPFTAQAPQGYGRLRIPMRSERSSPSAVAPLAGGLGPRQEARAGRSQDAPARRSAERPSSSAWPTRSHGFRCPENRPVDRTSMGARARTPTRTAG